ncbi:hypothetical protein EV175_002280 [Coemansia sp. RSA 1933]|nr:hypothetical protein EV175_002280 [Coemansia sp. RSA 1933]
MPRHRRRRRLEWTNSMQSDTTIVEVAAETHYGGGPTASSNDFDANTRPPRIRSAAPDRSQSTDAAVVSESQPIVRQSAPVTRSDSEQTTAGVTSDSNTKMEHGLGRRIKDSIVRRLRLFSSAFAPSQTHNGTHGTDGYYAVSMY